MWGWSAGRIHRINLALHARLNLHAQIWPWHDPHVPGSGHMLAQSSIQGHPTRGAWKLGSRGAVIKVAWAGSRLKTRGWAPLMESGCRSAPKCVGPYRRPIETEILRREILPHLSFLEKEVRAQWLNGTWLINRSEWYTHIIDTAYARSVLYSHWGFGCMLFLIEREETGLEPEASPEGARRDIQIHFLWKLGGGSSGKKAKRMARA